MRVLIVSLIIMCGCRSQESAREVQISKDSSNSSCAYIGKIENLELLMENNQLLLNWRKPTENGTCAISYFLDVYNDLNKQVYSANTTDTTYSIDFDFIGCMIYRLTVLPVAEEVDGVLEETSLVFSKEVKPPSCEPKEITNSSAILECQFNLDNDNLCGATDFVLNCKAHDDTQTNVNKNVTVVDGQTRVVVDVGNLSVFTNYTCKTSIKNRLGESVRFQTREGVPDSPTLNLFTSVTNTSFTATWEPPTNVPGVITTYKVTVLPKRPLYFVPEYCNLTLPMYQGGETDSSQLQYTVKNLLPSFEYEVFVTAKTTDYGPASERELIHTKGGIPEEPKDVNFDVVETEDNRTRLELHWSFPCLANNVITSFRIDVIGYPLIDHNVGEIKNTKVEYTTNTSRYQTSFANLEPAFNCTVSLKSISQENFESDAVVLHFKTRGSSPDPPVIERITSVNSTSFTIEWLEPPRKNGELDGYYIYAFTSISNDYILEGCPEESKLYVYESLLPNLTTFTFTNAMPGSNYTVIMQASSEGQKGSNVTFHVRTLDAEPEEVRDLSFAYMDKHQEYYNGNITISFKPPCHLNGNFKYITITLNGTRPNKRMHFIKQNVSIFIPEYNYRMEILAECWYELSVEVVTEHYSKKTTKNFMSASGVPLLTNYHMQSPIAISSSQAKFNISKYLFDDSYGDIIYYAVIIGQCNNEEIPTFGHWNGDEETWPVVVGSEDFEGMQPHYLTPKFWNPFAGNNVSEYMFLIQESVLDPNVWYCVKVRGFTKYGYRDSSELIFKLPEDYDVSALIFGIIFGILGTAILLGSVFILWRKKRRWVEKKESINSISLTPMPICVKKFPQYYSELSNDAEKLKQEYVLLISKSSEITLPCTQGLLPQNKKKNRYTNVIAYDHSRVKLKDVEEDGSDYINASYIKGYTGNVEYIATQGPLEHTVVDFWKMVIEENSTVIVMVAQFVEQNKDKCYRYFPNNHENMELENGIAIRCCTELDFKTYIVRTLLVQKDLKQWTITHLQFTDWPDFGCPVGTQMMLEFCRLMREYASKSDSPIILHCSAGIGRTGTLIALDILLQTINEDKDVDIFNTVLNLRKDRKNMVQTEKQYLYIHNCISDAIEQPVPINNCVQEKEPIYENLEEIKKEQNGLNVKESEF